MNYQLNAGQASTFSGTSADVPRPSRVNGAMQRQSGAISKLEEMAEHLLSRLDPVLSQESRPQSPNAPPSVVNSLAGAVDNSSDRLEKVNSILSEILDRLEI